MIGIKMSVEEYPITTKLLDQFDVFILNSIDGGVACDQCQNYQD
jgi:hypothetical protein